jgi:1,4-dihydroxy-2-naphthoyl-CoA hydrolase
MTDAQPTDAVVSKADPTSSEQNRRLVETMPHAVALGVEIDDATAAEVTGHLAWRSELTTLGGAVHGGALMALADSLGAVCAFLNLPEGALGTSTIESKTNFFRGVTAGHVHASAKPLHVGRSTVVVQTDLRDDAGRHVAQITQTQSVLYPRT